MTRLYNINLIFERSSTYRVKIIKNMSTIGIKKSTMNKKHIQTVTLNFCI